MFHLLLHILFGKRQYRLEPRSRKTIRTTKSDFLRYKTLIHAIALLKEKCPHLRGSSQTPTSVVGIYFSKQRKTAHHAGARVGVPWEDSGAVARAGKWVGSRVLPSSLPAGPSPSLAQPPPPLPSPPQSLPQLSPPFVLSAPLVSCPSPPAPSGSLTAVSGLDSGGGCFPLRNPVKFNRSRGVEQRAESPTPEEPWCSPPLVKRGGSRLETCLGCRAAQLSGEPPPSVALSFPCFEGPSESLPRWVRGHVTALGRGQAGLGGYRPAWRRVLSQRFLAVGGGGRGQRRGSLAGGLECRTSLGKGPLGLRAAEVPSLVRWFLRLLRAGGRPARLGVCRRFLSPGPRRWSECMFRE